MNMSVFGFELKSTFKLLDGDDKRCFVVVGGVDDVYGGGGYYHDINDSLRIRIFKALAQSC